MKNDKIAFFNLSIIVYAIIEELEKEGASLSPLLIEYSKQMKPYYDKVSRKEENNDLGY